MAKRKTDKSREERIDEKIIVDCYGEAERAMGWYYYLECCLKVAFNCQMHCNQVNPSLEDRRNGGSHRHGAGDECEREMFVTIRWEKRKFGVPLSQLEGIKASKETKEAVENWRYWVSMGYEF